ncbi:sodium:solute symporter [Echinicola sediminis]
MIEKLTLSEIDISVVGLYLGALLLIGFWNNKKKENAEDLFLSGRDLTWPKIGFSLFSTNVSPMMLIGFAGLAYKQGMVGANFEWMAWIYMMVLAMVFVPHYQKNKISTMPGFLDLRYGKRAHAYLSYYSLVSIVFIWLGCTLYAGGLIIAQALGIPLYLSVIGIAIVAVSYTAIGGLSAVVRTDVFQSLLILLGSAVLTLLAFLKIGSFDNLYHGVPESFWNLLKPTDDPHYPWHAVVFGYGVVAIFFFCTDQTIVQKVLAAKNEEQGQKGVLFTAFLKILMPVIFILPGIMAYVLYPGLKDADEAYLRIVTGVLPVGMIGLMVAVMLAALINTIAAGLNSFSTVFTIDVFKKYYPDVSESKVKLVGQIVTVSAALLAVLLSVLFSLLGKGLFELSQGLLNFFAPPLAVVFLVGTLWKRATPKAAEITLLGGGGLSLLVGTTYFSNYPYEGYWPNFLSLSFYLFLIMLTAMVLLSLVTKPVYDKALPVLREEKGGAKGYSSAQVWILWGVLAVVMLGFYIFFN